MAQRQFRTDDTSVWNDRFGTGSDGSLVISGNTTESPIDASCSGTSGTTSLSATNGSFAGGQLILIHQTRGAGVGAWELNKIASYSVGTITTSYALINTYTDSGASQAQVRVLPQYSSVTVDTGITYTAKAWDGDVGGILAFVCNGTTTVTGSITSSGKGHRGGASAVGGQATQGEGTSGAGTTSTTANGTGGGGGQGDVGNRSPGGGGGGYGAAGTDGTASNGNPGGTGGGTAGTADLVTADVGGGGGGGARGGGVTGTPGDGSPGGGFILIISKTITVTGSVTTNGTNGVNGTSDGGGGGGGAGGSVLLKGQNLVLGSSLITASAGSGGSGGVSGGAGGVGRIHADYSTSISGTTTPALDSSIDAIFIDPSTARQLSTSTIGFIDF